MTPYDSANPTLYDRVQYGSPHERIRTMTRTLVQKSVVSQEVMSCFEQNYYSPECATDLEKPQGLCILFNYCIQPVVFCGNEKLVRRAFKQLGICKEIIAAILPFPESNDVEAFLRNTDQGLRDGVILKPFRDRLIAKITEEEKTILEISREYIKAIEQIATPVTKEISTIPDSHEMPCKRKKALYLAAYKIESLKEQASQMARVAYLVGPQAKSSVSQVDYLMTSCKKIIQTLNLV